MPERIFTRPDPGISTGTIFCCNLRRRSLRKSPGLSLKRALNIFLFLFDLGGATMVGLAKGGRGTTGAPIAGIKGGAPPGIPEG